MPALIFAAAGVSGNGDWDKINALTGGGDGISTHHWNQQGNWF